MKRTPSDALQSDIKPDSAAPTTLVHVEQVSVCYTRPKNQAPVLALQEVSLAVAPATFTAIVGPSGSGKSTLLHIVGGLLTPTAGGVSVAGYRLSAATHEQLAHYRRTMVGFVFQAFHLLPHFTAWENVSLPLMAAAISSTERKRRAKEALQVVGLEERLLHYPGQLSGGEQQRVALARAIVHKPALILADEPTGNLDAENTMLVLDLMGQLIDKGMTIICATHDEQVAQRARQILRLRYGAIAG